MGKYKLLYGDCKKRMRELPPRSIDSIVTDPPYEIGFMGKSWDNAGIAYDVVMWRLCYRLLKPGGHLLAFGGSRAYHRMAVAIEDAGFEIRDSLVWLYGTGFPKSLDVSKAIDKTAGVEPRVVGPHPTNACPGGPWCKCVTDGRAFSPTKHSPLTAPGTPEAEKWAGWGTALKPAHEPIILARKPLSEKTVAANVLKWGTGGLNIDSCRVGSEAVESGRFGRSENISPAFGKKLFGTEKRYNTGRFPSNIILSKKAAIELDRAIGDRPGMRSQRDNKYTPSRYFGADKPPGEREGYNDNGGPSRFFYVAKASRKERDTGVKNNHPTVKPIRLMRYLVRMVTPAGGLVFDPFMGSGTTGIATLIEGFRFLGIEKEASYFRIAKQRIRNAVAA